jgi:hypothetical protein
MMDVSMTIPLVTHMTTLALTTMMLTQTNAVTTTLRHLSLLTFAAHVLELLNQPQSLKSQLLKSQQLQ